MSKPVSYAGLNFQGGNYRTIFTDAYNPPPRSIKTVDIARGHGAVATFLSYGAKPIELNGWIKGDDSDSLEMVMDELKAMMNKQKDTLSIGMSGGTRYWQAILRNIIFSRSGTQLTRAGFSAEFFCPNPFATNGENVELFSASGITDLSWSSGLTALGTYLAMPLITITINSIDPDDSDVEIQIGNVNENHYLAVTDTFVAGDVITIDTVKEKVYLNEALIPADGLFPLWAPGGGGVEVTANATTIDYDIIATYDKRFL